MNVYKRINLLGIASYFLFIIFAQLLWLFDPLRVGQHIYWIDIMDNILYLCIVIPFIWLIPAGYGIYNYLKNKQFGYNLYSLLHVMFLIRLLIVAGSIITMYFIFFKTEQLLWIGVNLTVTFTLLLFEGIIESIIEFNKTSWRGLIPFGISVAFGIVLLLPTSYTVTYPGLTMNMNKYAHIVDAKTKGEIIGVLIFERPAVPIDWLYAQLFPYYEIEQRKVTDISLKEQLDRVRTLKLDANQIASAIAFQKAGLGQGLTSHGAMITQLILGTPAADQLQIGDIIININGHAVSSVDDFQDIISMTQPGMDIHLTIIRSAEEIVFITKALNHPDDRSKAFLGARLIDNIRYDIPQEVVYYSYLLHKGGPSHGAMLTLTLINQLTPNGVTNGNKVAGTGTIRIDGTIGRIGGIKQKAYSVERAGADVFFVPADQYEEAKKGAEDLKIVPVKSLTEILSWLEENPKR